MKNNEITNRVLPERITQICFLFACCFLVIGGGAALMTLGGKNFLTILLQVPFKSAALGLSQIIGAGLAIIFIFSYFKKKLRFKLSTFILFGASIGLFSTAFSFLVSEILSGNAIVLLLHSFILFFLMPIMMTIVSIFKLGAGLISIICGAASGIVLYYLVRSKKDHFCS